MDLTEVYDHLAYAEFKLGNVKRAAHYTRLLLQNGQSHNSCLQPAYTYMYIHVHVHVHLYVLLYTRGTDRDQDTQERGSK